MYQGPNRLFVSVDMDDWYLARWATGSKSSIWKDMESCYQQVYSSTLPPLRLQFAVEKILELFNSLEFKSTFFITGYVAHHFKDLVKSVSAEGHEIACHNYFHIDYRDVSRKIFRKDLLESKLLLEDITGKQVIGYRSPNSSIPASLADDLLEFGFKYDSSVTPSFFMKYKSGDNSQSPRRPYRVSRQNVNEEGTSELFEFPWAVFPLIKLPAGSGILHRVAGNFYNELATNHSLQLGHTSYYFHPYEIIGLNEISNIRLPLKARIFLRGVGDAYLNNLESFLLKFRKQLINGERLLKLITTT